MKLPLRTRLAAGFALAVLAVVTPYAVLMLALEWRSERRALEHHLQEDLEVALQLLTTTDHIMWVTGEGPDPGYDAGEQRWVEVFNATGERVYARGDARRQVVQAPFPLPEADGFEVLRSTSGEHVRLLTVSRELDGRPYRVRVARSDEEIRSRWWALTSIFVVTIPLAMIAAGGAGHILAGRALRPIARLAARAQTITADRLHERLPVESQDELGNLARVFNHTIERLEDSFERLKRFTADASHELRTPLTALRSVGEVGLGDPRTPAQYRDIIGSMLEEANRLTRLVDDLLALSRFDSGRVRLSPAPVDLTALASEVAGHLGVLAEEKGIDVRVHPDGSAVAMVDRQTLRQALINVLDNAIKYSPPGQPVDIYVRRQDTHCTLTVEDRGPGIPTEHHSRIFDRFYRVDKARTRDIEGTGLGLAIAQWAVAASDGDITVDSAEGRGSRFTIRVPGAAPTPS